MRHWVAIDDEELLEGAPFAKRRAQFEGHVVKTESHVGLTMAAAEAGADEPTRRRACAASLRGFSAEEVRHSSQGGKALRRSKLSELREQLQLASINASSSERKELGALWTLLKDAEVPCRVSIFIMSAR